MESLREASVSLTGVCCCFGGKLVVGGVEVVCVRDANTGGVMLIGKVFVSA